MQELKEVVGSGCRVKTQHQEMPGPTVVLDTQDSLRLSRKFGPLWQKVGSHGTSEGESGLTGSMIIRV